MISISIFIFSDNNAKEHIASLLDKWYRKKAIEWFNKLFPVCQAKFPIKYQPFMENCPFSIQKMSTRWGSCTLKGKIILNPELIKAPKGSIEYVIVHELCHLIHYNHTKAFYDLQDKVLPDWRKRKERLENTLCQ